jgi:pimeloyl-ACP methyl ester carboxylesterase
MLRALALPLAYSFLIGCETAVRSTSATAADSTFASADGVRLAYSVDLPAGKGPFPAVVLVHASGEVTRQSMTPFARQFTAHGWAVLRYDKRGVGQSGGVYSSVGVRNSEVMIATLAEDAAAGLRKLASLPNIDVSHVGFAGASQAGWIIPPALVAESKARFAVILVGPTVSVGEEIFYSNVVENSGRPIDDGYVALETFTGDRGFDPRSVVRNVRVPALWLYGADDRSIPTRNCLAVHEHLRQLASPPQYTVIDYPGLGHSLSGAVWPDIYKFLDAQRRR